MGQLHSRGGNEITRKQKVFTLKNFFLILSIADPSGNSLFYEWNTIKLVNLLNLRIFEDLY